MISRKLKWVGYDFGQIIGRSSSFNETKHHSYLNTLKRLVDGKYFQNNRQIIVNSWGPSLYRLCRMICSMTMLEKLTFVDWERTPGTIHSYSYFDLTEEDLARFFQSCPKLTELRTRLLHLYKIDQKFEMGEELGNEFWSGCQGLRI